MRAGDRKWGWKVRHRTDVEGGGKGKGLRPTGALRSGTSRSLPCETFAAVMSAP